MVSKLSEQAENIMVRLNTIPEATLDFVTYMRYLDECGIQIDQLVNEVNFAYECFQLMQEYNIFVDETDKENYMG